MAYDDAIKQIYAITPIATKTLRSLVNVSAEHEQRSDDPALDAEYHKRLQAARSTSKELLNWQIMQGAVAAAQGDEKDPKVKAALQALADYAGPDAVTHAKQVAQAVLTDDAKAEKTARAALMGSVAQATEQLVLSVNAQDVRTENTVPGVMKQALDIMPASPNSLRSMGNLAIEPERAGNAPSDKDYNTRLTAALRASEALLDLQLSEGIMKAIKADNKKALDAASRYAPNALTHAQAGDKAALDHDLQTASQALIDHIKEAGGLEALGNDQDKVQTKPTGKTR